MCLKVFVFCSKVTNKLKMKAWRGIYIIIPYNTIFYDYLQELIYFFRVEQVKREF
jgi:hypothetical protein